MGAALEMETTRKINKNAMAFHEFLEHQIEICGKSQKQIAEDIGYAKPNIITMFKQGLTKVPIAKIKPLAISIGVDPTRLLRMAMSEYMPEALDTIEDVIGLALTTNEVEIVKELRNLNPDDGRMGSADSKKALRNFAKTLI